MGVSLASHSLSAQSTGEAGGPSAGDAAGFRTWAAEGALDGAVAFASDLRRGEETGITKGGSKLEHGKTPLPARGG